MKKIPTKKGIMTLLGALMIGAVGLIITVSAILLSVNSSKSSLLTIQSSQAKMLAGACAEEALEQIRNFTPFVGSGNLALTYGTCTYDVADNGTENRTIENIGTVGTVVRKNKIIINQINPSINIVSWQEVADF